jgi:hypothetical protein
VITSSKMSRMPCLSQICRRPLEVALGRDQHPGGAGDGLDNHRRDRGRVVQRHQPLQLVGELHAMLRHTAREGVAGEVVGVANVIDPGQQGPEHLAIGDDATHRDAAEIRAVITALAADKTSARALASHAMIGERDLQRGVDRFGAGIAEEDMVETGRRDGYQPGGELERLGVAHLERRGIIQFDQLMMDGVRDLRAAVTGIDAPQAGGAVEQLSALGVPVAHALRANQHSRLALELPVRRIGHPESFKIVGSDGDRFLHGRVFRGPARASVVLSRFCSACQT